MLQYSNFTIIPLLLHTLFSIHSIILNAYKPNQMHASLMLLDEVLHFAYDEENQLTLSYFEIDMPQLLTFI